MENIDKIFKKGLQEGQMTPSASVWDKIQDSGVIGGQEEKVFWLRSGAIRNIAASAAVLLMLFSSYFYFSKSQDPAGPAPQLANEDVIIDSPESDDDTIAPTIQQHPPTDHIDTRTGTKLNNQLQNKPKRAGRRSDKKALRPAYQLDTPQLASNEKTDTRGLTKLPLRFNNIKSDQSVDLPQVVFSQERYDGFRIDLQLSPEELLYAAENLDEVEERSLPGKLLDLATTKLNVWADAAGFTIPRFGRISEIEITY